MAPLQRAFALEQRHHVAMGIAEHLHLDVARLGDILFDQHLVVAERRCRLALGGGDRFGEFIGRADKSHAPAAAAGRGLDQHRITDAVGC